MIRISYIALLILLPSAFGSAAQQLQPSSGDSALDRQIEAGFSAYARGQNADAKRTFESVRAALEPLAVPRLELAVALNMLMAIETREDAGRRTTEWYPTS